MKNNKLYSFRSTFLSFSLKKNHLIVCLFTFFASAQLNAQILPCGLDDHQHSYLDEKIVADIDETAKMRSVSKTSRGIPLFKLRIYLHVSRKSDGTTAITENKINRSLELLDEVFGPQGFVFTQGASIDYIDDTDRYEDKNYKNVWATNFKNDGINIYYHPSIQGAAGIALLGGLKFAVRFSSSTSQTFNHEMGHCLGLEHTHATRYGAELVDGSNSARAGDRIIDTPADPQLPNGMFGCLYFRPFYRDANGDQYNPLTDNIMSYAPTYCQKSLTPGQYEYCRNTLLTSTSSVSRAIIEYIPDVTLVSNSKWNEINKPSIKAYPNPAENYFNLELKGDVSAEVYIYHLSTGREVLNTTIHEGNNKLETTKMPAGLYVIKAIGTNFTEQMKLCVRQ